VNFGYQYAYCTPTIQNCEHDFFSVILHEITHCLGFLSFGIENAGALTSRFGDKVFSKLDEHFLYYNNSGVLQKLFDINFSSSTGVNPALPALNAASNSNVWLNNSPLLNKQNQPIYSRTNYSSGTSLSHFDDLYAGFDGRAYISPGYSPNYNMNGTIATHQFKRWGTQLILRTPNWQTSLILLHIIKD